MKFTHLEPVKENKIIETLVGFLKCEKNKL
jgi:hypothetical protein